MDWAAVRRLQSTRGGLKLTELKLLAVRPTGVPSAARAVTMVPPMPVLARRWSGHLAAQFLLGWTLATALVVLPMLAWGSPDAARFSAGFAAGCLLLLPLAWVHGATLTGEPRWSPQVTNMASIVMGSVVGGVCQGLEVAPLHSLGGFALLTSGLALAVALRTGRAANPKASGH